MVSLLAGKPGWRATFFNLLSKSVRDEDTPLRLMIALKEAASPPSIEELAPYINILMSKDRVEVAYNAWLQLIPHEKLATLSFLNNDGFEDDPSGLPFDWSINRSANTMVDFVPLKDSNGERALRFSFGIGRDIFPRPAKFCC